MIEDYFLKITGDPCHPLYHLVSKAEVTSYQLCAPLSARPKLNTERFKDSFFNRYNYLSQIVFMYIIIISNLIHCNICYRMYLSE